MSLNQEHNLVYTKARDFAVMVIRFCRILRVRSHEYATCDQLLRAATSIGANIAEATQAQSDKDFISKLSIALKEAAETSFWLDVLQKSELISTEEYLKLDSECDRLLRILTSIIKSSRSKLSTNQ